MPGCIIAITKHLMNQQIYKFIVTLDYRPLQFIELLN